MQYYAKPVFAHKYALVLGFLCILPCFITKKPQLLDWGFYFSSYNYFSFYNNNRRIITILKLYKGLNRNLICHSLTIHILLQVKLKHRNSNFCCHSHYHHNSLCQIVYQTYILLNLLN